MKVFLTLLLGGFIFNLNAQIGIGTSIPHPSAILDISSSSKGFLPPRLTNEQRSIIASPEPGLIIYNLDNDCIQYYNGTNWYDPCCENSVSLGIDNFNYLLRLDPSDETKLIKMDTNNGTSLGISSINEDYIYSFISSTPGTEALVYANQPTGETATNGHAIFQYTKITNAVSYKSTSYISRVKNYSGSDASGLRYDLPADHQGEFDVFLVARMDSSALPYPKFASFFSSSDNASNSYSFQLGVGNNSTTTSINGTPCTNDYYLLNYRKTSVSRLCGTTNGDRVNAGEGNLHTFNINSSTHPINPAKRVFSLFIDGNLVESDSTLDDYMKIDMLRLFSNRNTSSGATSDISEVLVFTHALTTEDRKTLNEYLICKYGE